MGLRAQKKAKTRKTISDLATMLFIQKGFDHVTVAEIAQQAEVSVPTLFNYFPTKESLVFDEDEEREAKLTAAVTGRKKGVSILDALEEHFSQTQAMAMERREDVLAFRQMVESTPALAQHSRQMWMRYELSLAATIEKELGRNISALEAGAVAHYILDAFFRSYPAPDPKGSLRVLFKIIKQGWKES